MITEMAVLADCANIAAGEKLNVMGVFSKIGAPQFPAVHPFMALVLRLRVEYEDGNRTHDFTVLMQDEDGRQFFKAEAKVPIPAIKAGATAHIHQVLNFAGVSFAKPGDYIFVVRWNGDEVSKVILTVEQVSPGSTP